MKTTWLILGVLGTLTIYAPAQEGGIYQGAGAINFANTPRPNRWGLTWNSHAPAPADGVWIRQIGTNIYDIKRGGWTDAEGEVTSESDGLAILVTDKGEIALKNYPDAITNGKKISVAAVENGIYKWGDIPLQIWDCGKAYVPPPPTPEEIAAAKIKKEEAAKAAVEKTYQAQANAVRWLQPQATNGDANAQCSLGLHYLNGQGCETNREQGIYWLKKAADQGDSEASNALARLQR